MLSTPKQERAQNLDMFCFQCEQTSHCQACTGARGVCGKDALTAKLQDRLTGALISLSQMIVQDTLSSAKNDEIKLIIDGLFTTVTNVSFDPKRLGEQINEVHLAQKLRRPADPLKDYDLNEIWQAEDLDIRSLKTLILLGLRGMAAYAHHAAVLGYQNEKLNLFFVQALASLPSEDQVENLLELSMALGQENLTCMALLDQANTESYGHPEPTEVSLEIEAGPFIVVSGHDLHDLKCLLEQSAGRGVHIYTHGEMLPAHAYPKLKAYPHFKGHYGTAWQSQQKEFDQLPGAILFTTNCLMPPKDSYRDRVFTTALVAYPGLKHIDANKDFSPVIERALALGGFAQSRSFHGINGGEKLVTGFGHHSVLSVADKVIDAVKSGQLRHIFLVGGCDGARPGRNYYTDFVKNAPADSLILTLACGKFRFNDLDLGDINGIPRLLDMGQCNDAYSAIQVALALAKVFECSVNDLPLSLILSWYEQKAVCILLTLLSLGIRSIRLGPTLPAFISESVLEYLVKHFDLKPINPDPLVDLADILAS